MNDLVIAITNPRSTPLLQGEELIGFVVKENNGIVSNTYMKWLNMWQVERKDLLHSD